MRSLISFWTISILACSIVPTILADDKDSAPDRTTTRQDIRRLEERLLKNYTATTRKKKKNTPKLKIPTEPSVFSSSVPLSPINPGLLPDTPEKPRRDTGDEEDENRNWILPPSPDFSEDREYENFVPYGQDLMERIKEEENAEAMRARSRGEDEPDDDPSRIPHDLEEVMRENHAAQLEFSRYGDKTPTDEQLFFEEMLEEEDEASEEENQNGPPDFEFGYRSVIETTTFIDEENADSEQTNSDFIRSGSDSIHSEAEEEAYIEAMVNDRFLLGPTDSEPQDDSEDRYSFAFFDQDKSEGDGEPDMAKPFWRTQEAIRSILYRASPDLSAAKSGVGSFETSDESTSAENPSFRSASTIIQSIRNGVTGENNLTYPGGLQTGIVGMESTAADPGSGSEFNDIPAPGSITGITGRSLDLNPGLFSVTLRDRFGGSPQISTDPVGAPFGSSDSFGLPSQFEPTPTTSPMNRKRERLDPRSMGVLMK